MNLVDFDCASWRQEIEPFGDELFFQNRTGGTAVKLQLAAIKFGTFLDLSGGYLIGFKIYNDQALRCANQHINYALNNDYFVARRSSLVTRIRELGGG